MQEKMKKIIIQGQEKYVGLGVVNEDVSGMCFNNQDSYDSTSVDDIVRVGKPINFSLEGPQTPVQNQVMEDIQLYVDRAELKSEELGDKSNLGYICTSSEELAKAESALGLIPRDLPHEGFVLQFYKVN